MVANSTRTTVVDILLPLLVGTMAVLTYSQRGFEEALARDDAVYAYAGQRMAEGVPPYVSIFDHKGPLAPLLAGLAAIATKHSTIDDLLVVRSFFFLIACLAAVGLYLLGQALFGSRSVGLLTVASFLACYSFSMHAAAGPRPKTPMVLFIVLALLFTARRRWFWGGVFGALSALTWQPTAIYALCTLVIALCQPRPVRGRSVLLVLAGALVPLILVGAYFAYHGSLRAAIDGTFLFNLVFLERKSRPLLEHFTWPLSWLIRGYRTMAIPICLGIMTMCVIYRWRIGLYGATRRLLAEDAFAPLLLTFPLLVLWSLVDFQGYADWYIFLPYAMLGFGYLLGSGIECVTKTASAGAWVRRAYVGLVCALFVAVGAGEMRQSRTLGLREQRRIADAIQTLAGPRGQIVSVGAPEVFVLLHRVNPNRFLFIINGFDNYIEAQTPGGFEAWVANLADMAPEVVVQGKTFGRHVPKLYRWLRAEYKPQHMGRWTVWVRKDISRFSAGHSTQP